MENKVESDDWANVKWLQRQSKFKKLLKNWIIKRGGNFPVGFLKGKRKCIHSIEKMGISGPHHSPWEKKNNKKQQPKKQGAV